LGNPCDNACGWWILWEMMDVTEGRSHQSWILGKDTLHLPFMVSGRSARNFRWF
jgi:hypothetical protein